MTLLPGAGSFPEGLAGEARPTLPETVEGKARTAAGSRRTAFEILATWALLEGTKTATESDKTVSAMRVQRARLGMSVFRRLQEGKPECPACQGIRAAEVDRALICQRRAFRAPPSTY
jgi:hypothetical protein